MTTDKIDTSDNRHLHFECVEHLLALVKQNECSLVENMYSTECS
jgi:hypothetical protein